MIPISQVAPTDRRTVYTLLFVITLAVTTHVQSISLCLHYWPIWNIQCHYAVNSNVRGCLYQLISRFQYGSNFTGLIPRERTEGKNEVIRYNYPLYNLHIAAYAWEAGADSNSYGTFPVRRIGACPP